MTTYKIISIKKSLYLIKKYSIKNIHENNLSNEDFLKSFNRVSEIDIETFKNLFLNK